MAPTFELVQVISNSSATVLQVAYIHGLSTLHGNTKSDRGRLYAKLSHPANYLLELFSKPSRASQYLVSSGQAAALGEWFDLTAQNSSGITGSAIVKGFSADDSTLVIVPSWATDVDVLVDPVAASRMPGWDPVYGLAAIHAAAVREIWGDALPNAVPHLFGGAGISAFTPYSTTSQLPDLRTIAAPEQLRIAQGSLVKALSAEQAEHLEEFALMAKAARARFDLAMERLAAANTKDEEAAAESPTQGPSVSTYIRG